MSNVLVPLSKFVDSPDAVVSKRTEWQVRTREDGSTYTHRALDISCPVGTPIKSPGMGVLQKKAYQKDGAGYYIKVFYPNTNVLMKIFHLRELPDLPLEHNFAEGDIMAYSGNTGHSTGPHVHFETWKDGHAVRPSTVFDLTA